MKIRKKRRRDPAQQRRRSHNIVGCLLEDATKVTPQYQTAADTFGAENLIAIEQICREAESREVAIAQIEKVLESCVSANSLHYIAAVLEASFNNKLESERIAHELHDNPGSC